MLGRILKAIFCEPNDIQEQAVVRVKCDKYAPCYNYVYGSKEYSREDCAKRGCCDCAR